MSYENTKYINILYVEDDKIVSNSISNSLNLICNKTFTANDGAQALKIISENKDIDLIISDIRMPNINGIEFIQEIRKQNEEIPIIITTAFNEIEYLQKAIELKVETFIQKPINVDKLFNTLEKISTNIINKKEIEKKKLQLENYKKAIEYSNLILNISPTGEIKSISKDLTRELKNTSIKNIKDVFEKDIIDQIFKKAHKLDVYNKTTSIIINNYTYTVNITSFSSKYNNELEEITIILKDLTSIVKEKEHLIKQLYKDPTTNLLNKYALFDALNKNEIESLSIVEIDEYPKFIKMYGYKIGEIILESVAKNLIEIKNMNSKIKEIYKLDAERFAINISNKEKPDKDTLKKLNYEIIEFIENQPLHVNENYDLDISISIGVTIQEEEDIIIESLIALDVAKMKKISLQVYKNDFKLKQYYQQNLLIQKKIKNAFSNNSIIPYFQAIVDKNKNIVKYEALARLVEDEEILTPYHFLEVLKNSKHYVKFTKTIIEKSFKAMKELNCGISINLSYEDISNPIIINFLETKLKEHPRNSITIELLEDESLKDLDATIEFCRLMKGYGAQIAIDDFGSGYSNFEYLTAIPLDKIKIDGSLIKKINDYRVFVLVESIVTFSKKLGLKIVAEFVEDEDIFEKLLTLDIDMYQGYYFNKPKALEEIVK